MIELSKNIVDLIEQARVYTEKSVNITKVYTYFSIGQMLIEEYQHGKERADYGKQLLQMVSSDLTEIFGRGFSVQNLENMRIFYSTYLHRFQKSQTVFRISEVFQKSSTNLRISDMSFTY